MSDAELIAWWSTKGCPFNIEDVDRAVKMNEGDQPPCPAAKTPIEDTTRHYVWFPRDLDESPEYATLKADQPTSLCYEIAVELAEQAGATAACSTVPTPSSTTRQTVTGKLQQALRAGDEIDVQFQCSVCVSNDNTQPVQRLKWNADGNATNRIEFKFTPTLAGASPRNRPASAMPGITLILSKNGIERFDEVHICINVVGRAARCGEQQGVDGRRSNDPISRKVKPRNGTNAAADLSIRFEQQGSSRVSVRIEIYDGILFSRIRSDSQVVTSDLLTGRSFPTQFAAISKLQDGIGETYLRLSCLVADDDDFRRWVRKKKQLPCARRTSLQGADWKAEDPREVQRTVGEFRIIGVDLYKKLFVGSADLLMRSLMRESQRRLATGEPPVRVRVYSPNAIHLPIQILFAPLDDRSPLMPGSEGEFFGYLFDLALDKVFGDTKASIGVVPKITRTVFGLYGATTQNDAAENCSERSDPVAVAACEHLLEVSRLLHLPRDRAVGLGKATEFLTKMNESNSSGGLDLVVFFGHGQNRAAEKAVAEGSDADPIRFYNIVSDPRLQFVSSESEEEESERFLRPGALNQISDSTPDVPALAGAPIVMLIACESGAAGLGGTGGADGFVQSFLALGARGVVATEAEVHPQSGSRLGLEFLQRVQSFQAGPPEPSRAMLEARIAIYKDLGHNLWPLLFYYAGPNGAYPEE